MSSDKRRWTRLLLAAVMALCLSFVVVACGDDDDEGSDGGGGDSGGETSDKGGTIKLAILSNCEGAFGAFYEPDIAGAQVPLINRGAKVENPKKPSDGITGAEIAGKKVEIVGYGCSDGTADKAIEETRRLMEQEKADILIGPLSGDESIAVANYAKEHPDQTFINGAAGAQDASLKVQAPNLLPLQHGRRAVLRRAGRLRLQRARLAHGGGYRRRLRVPVYLAGRLHRRVLLGGRQGDEARLAAAG